MDKTINKDEKNKVILKHQDGTIEKLILTEDETRELNKNCSIHLCGAHCKYAFANKCPKVTDRYKKSIDKYDFITEGFQVFKNDGYMDRFRVTGCNKYKKDMSNAHPTRKQQRKMHELANSLRTAYFDETDLNAAYIRQYLEEQRGTLKGIYGRRVPEELILEKIAALPDGEELLKEIKRHKIQKQKRIAESGLKVSKKEQEHQEMIMKEINKHIRQLGKERLEEEAEKRAKIATYTRYGDRMKRK